jgi:hypothetical protein
METSLWHWGADSVEAIGDFIADANERFDVVSNLIK